MCSCLGSMVSKNSARKGKDGGSETDRDITATI